MFQWVDPDDPGSRGIVEYPIEVPLVADASSERSTSTMSASTTRRMPSSTTRQTGSGSCECSRRGASAAQDQPGTRLRGEQVTVGAARLRVLTQHPGAQLPNPGDGKGPIHEKTKAWADQFQHGDPEYQTDEKWYATAVLHDNPPAPADDPVAPSGDILADKGINIPGTTPSQAPPTPPPAPPESEDQRRARMAGVCPAHSRYGGQVRAARSGRSHRGHVLAGRGLSTWSGPGEIESLSTPQLAGELVLRCSLTANTRSSSTSRWTCAT